MPFSAVLFDLDGTLLDTLADVADATNAALAQLGFPPHPVEAFKYFIGDGMEQLARRALGPGPHDPELVARCVERIRQEYARCWDCKTRPYAGVSELLDQLASRGVPMAVLSNKPQDFTQLCVQRLLGRWRFDAVVGAGGQFPPKPHPAAARCIAQLLKVPPPQIVYLGDTNTDMQTATAAGMYPVGALWGFRPAEELRASGAQKLIAQPLELLSLLESQ